ncbi:MAG: N-acetylmuramoyl-L-alanine amidase [Novosphingobium sp.]|jgi:N-acetylmuramoyl-L-alanine amidase|nr:N-acetylmuramoyl-L-alanine amidase [Novosphingobium sp.]
MRRAITLIALFMAPIGVFAAMVAADRAFGAPGRGYGYVVRVNLPDSDTGADLPPVRGPIDASRPLVVIDPGHGGKDPGAINGPLQEKDLVLRLALALRDELLRQGGVRVALTREDDRYLLLPQRPAIARRLKADLFISIHADSTEISSGASGATVYVLSEKGSNEAAERIAARENAADEVNGIRIAETSDTVGSWLVDLTQRKVQAQSEDFGRLIIREGQERLPFRETTLQSAAFAVLKSPDNPSVLFETGYINNDTDAGRLASPEGRQAFAQSVASAIRIYFARQQLPATAAR